MIFINLQFFKHKQKKKVQLPSENNGPKFITFFEKLFKIYYISVKAFNKKESS